jgi:hypothetical protein
MTVYRRPWYSVCAASQGFFEDRICWSVATVVWMPMVTFPNYSSAFIMRILGWVSVVLSSYTFWSANFVPVYMWCTDAALTRLKYGLCTCMKHVIILTCICLRWRLFRKTLRFSRTELSGCDVMTRFNASRYVNLETGYISTCGRGEQKGVGGRKNKVNVYLPSLMMKVPDHVCLRRRIYMSHVNKVQPVRVTMICIAAIRVTCICVA